MINALPGVCESATYQSDQYSPEVYARTLCTLPALYQRPAHRRMVTLPCADQPPGYLSVLLMSVLCMHNVWEPQKGIAWPSLIHSMPSSTFGAPCEHGCIAGEFLSRLPIVYQVDHLDVVSFLVPAQDVLPSNAIKCCTSMFSMSMNGPFAAPISESNAC